MNVVETLDVLKAARRAEVQKFVNVYGPPQGWRRVSPVMSSFIIRMLYQERPIVYGTGKKHSDFIYIDDVNDLHLIILKDDRSNGRVFNVGSGVNFSVREIYQFVEEILETSLPPLYKPDLPGEAQVSL